MPGPRSTAKQHPKDHRERYDTHSYSQDYKDAYHVLNMLVSAVLGAEPHQVLVPLKRLFLISKPSMCPDTSTRHFAPGDRLIWFQGSLENSQTDGLWIEILDGFSARSSN